MAHEIREELVEVAQSLFRRGYSYGTAGNISAHTREGIVATPTNSSFGRLRSEDLSLVDLEGSHLSGGQPTKELSFHLGIYRAAPKAGAVVHLHSTYATAFSCLANLPAVDPLPCYTPYFPMRVRSLLLVPYHPPGSPELAGAVELAASTTQVMLLRNHGSVAWAGDLATASALAEELEEQCKLHFLLAGRGQPLGEQDVAELRLRFGARAG